MLVYSSKNHMQNLFIINNKNTQDPKINLAMEEYAVRNLDPSYEYILFYVNNPSVIIGRHQNVWEEVNLNYTDKNAIPIIRRISGGGTVYHDLGNLNYSIITSYDKKKFNNYRIFTEPVIKALQHLCIKAELNSHNAIVVNNKKISGNAQFTSKNRILSHGTLLFNTDLSALEKSLQVKNTHTKSKARKSIKNRVINISEILLKKMTFTEFKYIIEQSIYNTRDQIQPYEFSFNEWNSIKYLANDKYSDWDWNFGQSPDFFVQHSLECSSGRFKVDIMVRKGKIEKVELLGLADLSHLLTHIFKNIRYLKDDIHKIINQKAQILHDFQISEDDLLKLIFNF